MRILHAGVAVAASFSLSSCIGAPDISKVETVSVESVVRQIKSDVARYDIYRAAHANDTPLNNACGGHIDFEITSIAISLTTITERSLSGTVGAVVPATPFKFSGGGSRTTKSSQVVKFTLKPAPPRRGEVELLPNDGGFASVLINLRESLLRASNQLPCFAFADDQKNSIEFGFTITNANSAGGGVSFLIFTLGAERKESHQAANTVTVNFRATGETMLQP